MPRALLAGIPSLAGRTRTRSDVSRWARSTSSSGPSASIWLSDICRTAWSLRRTWSTSCTSAATSPSPAASCDALRRRKFPGAARVSCWCRGAHEPSSPLPEGRLLAAPSAGGANTGAPSAGFSVSTMGPPAVRGRSGKTCIPVILGFPIISLTLPRHSAVDGYACPPLARAAEGFFVGRSASNSSAAPRRGAELDRAWWSCTDESPRLEGPLT
mmetsp:Transcript_14040/g.49436  ORF Transcript_14040/g.49436 Transcript_14040/m.49436 type:complete len:214 (+) Transcript_14040:4060-4701(+)